MAEKGITRVLPALMALAEDRGFSLVDAELVREGQSRYLRIYIDKPGGITLEDCEAYHRAAQPMAEEVDYDFLEISSPGLDRPLKTQKDFDAHTGEAVELHFYRPQQGAKQINGRLAGLVSGEIVLDADGRELRFPQKDVSICRLAVEFSEADLAEAWTEKEDAGDAPA